MSAISDRAKKRWWEVCERLSVRDRELLSLVLGALAAGAASEDYAFTSDDLMELSRITVQGV
jgi:hypothetical protein